MKAPTLDELPSTSSLVKATLLAAVGATVLLVTVVLPAEYGIDPTGIGDALGLKRMGEIKTSLANELAAEEEKAHKTTEPAVADAVVSPAPTAEPDLVAPAPVEAVPSDEMQVTLEPDEGTEIKLKMKKGAKVDFQWSTSGGPAKFDIHGDSAELDIDYHSYEKGALQESKGELEAAFDGNHGWFWRNRTKKTMTITLKTEGDYLDIQHMK